MDRRGRQGGHHLSLAAGRGQAKAARSGLVALAAAVLFFVFIGLEHERAAQAGRPELIPGPPHMYRIRRLATTASAGSTQAAIMPRYGQER